MPIAASRLRPGALALLAALALAASAEAQSRLPVGTLEATAYAELEDGARIRVRRSDISDESARIAKLFIAGLTERGYRVASAGDAHALTFRLTVDMAYNRRAGDLRLPVRGDERLGPPPEPPGRLPPLFGAEGDATRLQSSPKTVEVELADERGRLLWSGRATADVPTAGLEEVAALVVPSLLDRLGQTVASQDIYAQ